MVDKRNEEILDDDVWELNRAPLCLGRKDKRNEEILDDDVIIEMTDEDGNVYYYIQELIIPVGDENFALLVEVKDDEHEHGAGCECDCDCDDDVIIAKIVVNAEWQEEYIEPTDEEFEKVQEAYEKLLDAEE